MHESESSFLHCAPLSPRWQAGLLIGCLSRVSEHGMVGDTNLIQQSLCLTSGHGVILHHSLADIVSRETSACPVCAARVRRGTPWRSRPARTWPAPSTLATSTSRSPRHASLPSCKLPHCAACAEARGPARMHACLEYTASALSPAMCVGSGVEQPGHFTRCVKCTEGRSVHDYVSVSVSGRMRKHAGRRIPCRAAVTATVTTSRQARTEGLFR